jgi:hypothetical protein
MTWLHLFRSSWTGLPPQPYLGLATDGPDGRGLVTSFLLELTVYPAVFAEWKGRHTSGDAPLPNS